MTLLLALAAFTWRAASLLLALLFLAVCIEAAGLTTERRPPVAYLNRTFTLRFDGTGTMPLVRNEDGSEKKLPNLGDGIFVTIRNPLLAPSSVLVPDRDVEVDDDGKPVDRQAAIDAGNEVVARLISDWCVPDPDDPSDDAPSLPLPSTLAPQERVVLMGRVPASISNTVAELISEARNPR